VSSNRILELGVFTEECIDSGASGIEVGSRPFLGHILQLPTRRHRGLDGLRIESPDGHLAELEWLPGRQ
jgi:hypothetical protein